MAKLSVSLSRAHKIAERLKELLKLTFSEIETQSALSSFSSKPAPSTLEELTVRGDLVLALGAKAEAYASAWSDVRTAISGANHARGIDKMLAELEMLGKLTASYKVMMEHAKEAGHLPHESLNFVFPVGAYGASLTINPMRDPLIADRVKTKLAFVQREAIKLSDTIAEANAPKIELELTEAIVAEVTGARLEA